MRLRRSAVLAILSASFVAARAIAQCTAGGPPNPPASPRTITGIVMDSAHDVLENAEVVIRAPKRQVRTNARGIFQLTDLEPGTYELTVRHIGHDIAVQSYVVTDSGGVARFCLYTDIQGLPAMVTSVFRGGISGVVGDTTLALVPGAEIRVLGENLRAFSDSAGAFFFPVKPGHYSVTAKKKGYGQQIVGVTVPKDSGRKIVMWLGSPPRNPIAMSNAIEAMRVRILMTPAFRYHRVSAEELANSPLTLEQLVRVKGQTTVLDDCEASIAGTGFSLPIYMLDKEEITLLEIVTPPLGRSSRGVTSMNGNKPVPNQGTNKSPNCPDMIVWMKP